VALTFALCEGRIESVGEGSEEAVPVAAMEIVEELQGEGVALAVEVSVAFTLALREAKSVSVAEATLEAVAVAT
jgi:hypothetical protein